MKLPFLWSLCSVDFTGINNGVAKYRIFSRLPDIFHEDTFRISANNDGWRKDECLHLDLSFGWKIFHLRCDIATAAIDMMRSRAELQLNRSTMRLAVLLWRTLDGQIGGLFLRNLILCLLTFCVLVGAAFHFKYLRCAVLVPVYSGSLIILHISCFQVFSVIILGMLLSSLPASPRQLSCRKQLHVTIDAISLSAQKQ